MDGMQQVHRPGYGRREFEKGLIGFQSRLLAFARTLTGNAAQADDLVQDTFLKALSSWEQFQPGTNQFAWICTVMRNKFLSDKRRDWRVTPLDQDMAERTISDSRRDQEVLLGLNQEFILIAPILALIGSDMANSVIGIHYLGMTYEEYSKIVGCAVGTVKSRVSRGLASIREIMSEGRPLHVDLSAWEHATGRFGINHPHYPIAKAYENLYAALYGHVSSAPKTNKEVPVTPKKIDRLWNELLASGDLEDFEDLNDLMRYNFDPH